MTLPGNADVTVIRKRVLPKLPEPDAAIRQALAHPVQALRRPPVWRAGGAAPAS